MRYKLCKHAGPVVVRQGTSKGGNRRLCALSVITPDTGHLRECQACERYEEREVSESTRPAKSGPCKYLGEELSGYQRRDRGLDSRRWAFCSHPERPLGEAVCGCKGCGRHCRGYQQE